MKKVRFGIIGFGAFAERAIMPAIRSSHNSELVALQKRSLDMAKWKATEHSVPFYFDSVEALASSPEIDAVFIVSANAQHHSETLTAAKYRKHVLVEKPMAINTLQAKEMIEACDHAGVKLMVGHMLRFSPLVQRMKEIIQSGMIGEITFAQSHFMYDARQSQRSWVLNKETAGGGPLFDIGIHCLDTMRYILDDDTVETVKSIMMPNHSTGNVEKTSVLALQFSQGVLATIYSSFESSYRQGFIEFVGTKGSISAYNFTPSNTEAVLEIKFGKEGKIDSIEKENFSIPNLYVKEVEHFSDCILHDKHPLITNTNSLHNQEILERAIHDSKK